MVALALTSTHFLPLRAQTSTTGVPVRMTVTLDVKGRNKRTPEIKPEDVTVRQGKDTLKTTGWVAARDAEAGLDMFVLIDEASDASLGIQLADLRSFIAAQDETTSVGVGYMSNGVVRVAQNLTPDHDAAAKAVRLPLSTAGAYGRPWLSAVDLMNRWPRSSNRRALVMITDGLDRPGHGLHFGGLGAVNPDVDTASLVAQRTGMVVYTIYNPGAGHFRRNYWVGINGQNGLAKLSEESGGEAFFLGLRPAVSFTPYLDRIGQMLSNQYLLTFEARPGKKNGLQRIKLSTEVAGVELISADNVWVPGAR
jgi:hypothetical protein